VDSNTRLRLATRIHFALLRGFAEHVAVASLLRGGSEAREALWVCDASGDDELAGLAQRFRRATEAEERLPAQRGSAAQDLAWSQDTSGFGLSRPLPAPTGAAPDKPGGWLHRPAWLRRGPAR
jgi:hypothetical protein